MVKLKLIILIILMPVYLVFAKDRIISFAELAKNSSKASCWIQIDDSVYDITLYLTRHNSKFEYNLEKWCGKNATTGWIEKEKLKKPHSRKAKNILNRYLIGIIHAKK